MKYVSRLNISLVTVLILFMGTMELSSKASKPNVLIKEKMLLNQQIDQAPQFTTNVAIVNDAVRDIKACLNNPNGKLSSVCCTYKFNGVKIVSKETKKYYDNYRKKPDYSKERFLDEDAYQTDKIVQVKFNKHSDLISITYENPNDGKHTYRELLDAAQFQLI